MSRKAGLLGIVMCLLLVMLGTASVQAQGELEVLDTSNRTEFPYELEFALSARSDANITDIRLHYIVDRVSYARVTSEVYIEFEPGPAVDVIWLWDMRKVGGLPPGTWIEYWWTVKDESGGKIETAPVQVQFNDTRYLWHSYTEDRITLYWYNGDDSFAQDIQASAQQALARLASDTGVTIEKPANIYIYASAGDLQGAMVFPQEWTGGAAFTRYGIIAIGIAPNNLDWGRRAVAHELTHLVIHQITLNPYNEIPTWLDEGLAMYTEGPLEAEYKAFLDAMIAEDNLISVRSLSSPFSAYAAQSLLAYAQSYSLVDFLITSYGQGKMLELLNAFKKGTGYDNALQEIYGFNMDGLDALWRDYVAG